LSTRCRDPVELGEPREEHCPDRDVDAHAEGVGAADHLQQAVLGELFDESPVAGEHARVVDADAAAHELGQRLAEAGGEAEPADAGRDGVLVLAGDRPHRQQRLGLLQGSCLGEVDDVDRRLLSGEQLLDRLVDRGERPRVAERHRPLGASHHGGMPAGPAGEVVGDRGDVPEGRRHEQELGVGQLQEGHLPRPAALWICVEVELVHDDDAEVCVDTLAQRHVGQDLGGAADDGGVGVDRGVAGHHSDVVGAEDVAQREELLAHQGLDRR
jgi:hypothetical protein